MIKTAVQCQCFCWCLYCQFGTYLSLSRVSVVDFENVFTCERDINEVICGLSKTFNLQF